MIPNRFSKQPQKKVIYNQYIKAQQVRLVDENGQQLGVMDFRDAANIAKSKGLDLIQVTEKVDPPVCKIGEYGKFLYQLEKKEREAKSKSVKIEHKTIQLGYKTGEHDLQTKAKQIYKFLEKGHKITILVVLRGREKAFANLAAEQLSKFLEMLRATTPIKVEQEIQKRPNGCLAIISKGK